MFAKQMLDKKPDRALSRHRDFFVVVVLFCFLFLALAFGFVLFLFALFMC